MRTNIVQTNEAVIRKLYAVAERANRNTAEFVSLCLPFEGPQGDILSLLQRCLCPPAAAWSARPSRGSTEAL